MLTDGPPSTVVQPCSRACRATSWMPDRCGCIPEIDTISAHSRSAARSGSTLQSAMRTSNRSSSRPANVINPRGGITDSQPGYIEHMYS
ncbi:MAG: hypothetical protein GY898_01505 [Proteobacteria bacterium]|nr:hypothetical protein [Pseudomonadota bacterium]